MLNGRKVALGDSWVPQKHENLTYLTFLNLPRIQLASAIMLCPYSVFIQ